MKTAEVNLTHNPEPSWRKHVVTVRVPGNGIRCWSFGDALDAQRVAGIAAFSAGLPGYYDHEDGKGKIVRVD